MEDSRGGGTTSIGQWLFTSTVFTGGMYATGYLVENGYSRLLGTSLYTQDPGQYLLMAGEYFLDLFTLVFESMAENMMVLAIMIFTVVAIYSTTILMKKRFVGVNTQKRYLDKPLNSPALCFVVICLVLIEIAAFDLPVIMLEATMLRSGVIEEVTEHLSEGSPRQSPFLQKRIKRIWTDLACSRDQKNRCGNSPVTYQNDLRNMYLTNCLVTGMLLVVSLLINRARGAGSTKDMAVRNRLGFDVLSGVLLLAIAVDVSLLPYVFGKTIRSTTFREAKLYVELSEPDQSQKGSKEVHAFILAENTNEFLVFEKETSLVWQIPRSQIKLLKVERLRDVLMFSINHEVGHTDAPLPLPPPS